MVIGLLWKEDISSLKTENLKKLICFFSIFVVIGTSSLGHSEDVSICLERPFSPEKKYLACLRNSKVAQAIRAGFNKILVRRQKCKKCADSFPGETNFSPLYNLNFLMMKVESNDFGGYWAHIIFKESPTRIYKLWFYPIEETTFQLRDIRTFVPSAETKEIMAKLSGTKYSQYWITPADR